MPYWQVLLHEMLFHCRRTAFRPMFIFSSVVQPMLFIAITYAMYSISGTVDFTSRVVLGSGVIGFFSSITFSSAADIVREREEGALELITITATPINYLLLAKSVTNALLGLCSLGLAFLYSTVLPESLAIARPGWFVLALLLLTVSFVGMGMMLASALFVSGRARVLQNMLEMPLLILSGALIPLSHLPLLLQGLARCLAPAWGVEALRLAVTGGPADLFLIYCLWTVAVTTCYFLITFKLFRVIEFRARRLGTLGLA